MTMSLGIEILLIALLGIAIWLAVRLQAKLAVLRREQAALMDKINQFDAAAQRASKTLDGLQSHRHDIASRLSAELAEAQSMINELSIMVHAANSVGDALDAKLVHGRQAVSAEAPSMRRSA